jgi:MT0933-like antitoxin protein
MSIFDKLRKSATKAVDQHGDKISRGLDKAAKSVDERTGHKHSHKIRKGVSKAKEGMQRLEDKDRGDDGPPDSGSTPPK